MNFFGPWKVSSRVYFTTSLHFYPEDSSATNKIVELNLEVFSLFFNYCLNDLALSELVFSCFEILDTSTYSFLPPLFITY